MCILPLIATKITTLCVLTKTVTVEQTFIAKNIIFPIKRTQRTKSEIVLFVQLKDREKFARKVLYKIIH